jgi:hypothetical protein
VIDRTVYLGALYLGAGNLPGALHLAGLALPPLLVGLVRYRANRLLAATGFCTLHVLAYAALAYLSGGAYPYLLYGLTAQVRGGGYTDLLAPDFTATALLYALPAALHGAAAALGGLALAHAASGRKGCPPRPC